MWYKNGIWCDSETDTDEDELPDYMELVLGTNINGTDSDSDGLSDGYEVLTLGTDPTLADSDSNNVSDAAEDADSDGLTNLSEYQLGTDPTVEDSDGDGLDDGDEVTTYLTDPTDEDTDSDGASDGWEITHNADPLIADVSFNVTVSLGFRDDDVAPSASAVLPGEQAESLAIEQVTDNEYFINETAGIIGNAYDFTTNGTISSAEISFEFDSDLLLDPDFDPVIYWFDEENQVLEPVATTVTNNTATAQVTHFSMYLLIDEREYLDEFDWVEEYTLYKDYDEIQVVFMIDSSAAMAVSDPNNLRYSHVVSIADSLPLNSKTSVIDFHDDVGDNIDYNGDLFMWASQYMQSYISDFFYYNIGGTTDIYPLFDYAMTGFDADTQNHTVLREIVILTDGGGLDPSEYSAALAEAKANDVVVSVLAYGASANQSVNSMMPITWATGGTYGTVSALSTFIQRFGNVLDFGTDTDNDGIPDDLEDDLILYNGKTISTDYELADTDEDGLKDGEEIRLEVKYSPDGNYATVVGHLISDPTSEDGDGDGYLDNCDEHPLEWDVGDRDLAMFAALAYEDGSNYIGSFYTRIANEPAKSFAGQVSIDSGEGYYWLNYACSIELSANWKIVDYQNILSNSVLNDHFSATTYKNGNCIVISYCGTSDEIGEWVDNFICYGFGNYHTEESLAEQYAMRIYNNYIAGNENAKLYITGHSLGGYLAQIGAAKLINTGNWLRLKKVVYFNGMGLKFNDFGFWQKNAEIEALELFGKNQGEPNGKLICYHIVGDIVSLLGTHCGEEKWFDATDLAKINHLIDFGRVIQDLIIGVASVLFLKISIPIIETISYYYGYYGFSSLEQYFWTTHETDSFLYHIHQGER